MDYSYSVTTNTTTCGIGRLAPLLCMALLLNTCVKCFTAKGYLMYVYG